MGDTEHVKVTSKTILGNLIRGQTIVYITQCIHERVVKIRNNGEEEDVIRFRRGVQDSS